jgi:hypothetical protein
MLSAQSLLPMTLMLDKCHMKESGMTDSMRGHSHVLDEKMNYGLLIVPSGQGVWHMNETEPGF